MTRVNSQCHIKVTRDLGKQNVVSDQGLHKSTGTSERQKKQQQQKKKKELSAALYKTRSMFLV